MKNCLAIALLLLLSVTTYSQNDHLVNGSFDQGVGKGWKFRVVDLSELKGYELNAVLDLYQRKNDPSTNCAKIRVISADRDGDTHPVNLIQPLKDIKKGKRYRVSFDIRSNLSREDFVGVQLFSSLYTAKKNHFAMCYHNKFKFKGDGKWKTITFEFDADVQNNPQNIDNKLDVENLKIRFGFGGRMGVYYFDNVTVTRV